MLLILGGRALGAGGATAASFPTFGVSMTMPAEWRPVAELGYGQVGRWLRIENKQVPMVVEFELVRPEGRTAEQIARTIAEKQKGKVGKSEVKIGDDSTFAVTMSAPAQRLAPRRVLVAQHGKQIFMLSLLADDPAKFDAEFNEAAKSVKFSNPVEPRDDLKLSARSVPLLGSGFMLHVPGPMRPDAVKDPQNEAFFGIQNYVTGKSEMSVLVNKKAKDANVTLGQIADQMERNLPEKMGIKTEFAMKEVKRDPQVYLSSFFPTKGEGNVEYIHAVAIFTPGAKELMFLNFQFPVVDARTTDAYKQLIPEMAKSLRYSTEYLRARDEAEKNKPK